MKLKTSKILNIIIAILVIYPFAYLTNRYLISPHIKETIENSSPNNLIKGIERLKKRSLEGLFDLSYGDVVQDHRIKDVLNYEVNVSKVNDNYKFIFVTKDDTTIGVSTLTRFLDIRKNFQKSNIDFLVITVKAILQENIQELGFLQKKFDIHISEATPSFVETVYKLPDCLCGFYLFLDPLNKVRFANYKIDGSTMRKIIFQELSKPITQ